MRWYLFFLPILCSSLEVQPWLSDCLEFHFTGSYSYSWFHKVQNGKPQLKHPFHANVFYLGLDFSPTPEWSGDVDVQFADTSQEKFNFRTAALQARYLWLDDIVGEPVSLTTGASFRFTNGVSLRDISCPSHANCDGEINLAMGKEFDFTDCFAMRLWGFGALGQANRGSPWVRGIVAIETNYDCQHKLAVLALMSHGFGRHVRVLVDDFHGYAKIREKSIDLLFRYGYGLGVWGTMRFEYQYRVLAKSCPANVNTVILSYLVPFSF